MEAAYASLQLSKVGSPCLVVAVCRLISSFASGFRKLPRALTWRLNPTVTWPDLATFRPARVHETTPCVLGWVRPAWRESVVARGGRDPYPFTWEIPAAVVVACGMVLAAGIHLGRGVAYLLEGEGFRWPTSAGFIGSLGAVLSGDPAAGLAQPVADIAPSLLVTAIIATEVLLLALVACAGHQMASRWGPAAPKGMATTSEAERLLGRSRLFRSRRIVRPDLYGARSLPAKGA